MRKHEMDRWADHCGYYFGQDPQTECMVLHPVNHRAFHIDLLLFPPCPALPFWKLCTMGASDYKLPLTFCPRNEFFLFIPESEDLKDQASAMWYCDVLLTTALYPWENHMALSCGHSIVWGTQPGTNMVSAYLDLPFPIPGSGFFRCKLGPVKAINCLQVTLLTRRETDYLVRVGPDAFTDFLYPEKGMPHFLSQRFRKDWL